MKTWEMIKELTEDFKKKFQGTDYNGNLANIYWEKNYETDTAIYDRVIVTKYAVDGEVIPFMTNNTFIFKENWTEVIEPVDFLTAYKDCLENDTSYEMFGLVMCKDEGVVVLQRDFDKPLAVARTKEFLQNEWIKQS